MRASRNVRALLATLMPVLLAPLAFRGSNCTATGEHTGHVDEKADVVPHQVPLLPLFQGGEFTPRCECFNELLATDGYFAALETRITRHGGDPGDEIRWRWLGRVDMAHLDIVTHAQSASGDERPTLDCQLQGLTRMKELIIWEWTDADSRLAEYSPNVEGGKEEEEDIERVKQLMEYLDNLDNEVNKEKTP